MPKIRVRHPSWYLALVAAIAVAIPAANAAQQDNPAVDSGGNTTGSCKRAPSRCHLRSTCLIGWKRTVTHR